jgi:aldose 1-epimerase
MDIKKVPFGKTRDGSAIHKYVVTNDNGICVEMINYGATITSLKVPDKNGKIADIVLGMNTLDEYLAGCPYFGSIVGRYGNRIAKGKFTLDGVGYNLAINNGENHLHGGLLGFDKVVWGSYEVKTLESLGVRFFYLAKDGEEGYPGNLLIEVDVLLNNKNELLFFYKTKTDQTTVCNPTNHAYFNLSGEGDGDILGHQMMINSETITSVDSSLIPTGKISPVKGTPLDFVKTHLIGERIADVDGGYDHNFVLNKKDDELSLAARVHDPKSGRTMEVFTTEPAVQFYSGNFLDGSIKGKSGRLYQKHAGFCLETQHYPDSPNHPEFPTTVLSPGLDHKSISVYRFSF